MALSVVLAGGGTGGHIFPALALADAIRAREPGARLRFIGTERGQETKLVPAAGYELELVPSTQILGRNPLRAAAGLLTVARGAWRARGLLREVAADLVIGVGGYASVPAVAAASLLGIPIVLLEPNARPGRANRLLGRVARRVFVQFEDAMAFFPDGLSELSGYPVREMPGRTGSTKDGGLELLVMGGSQGARSINRAINAALPRLAELDGFSIVHQTGALDLDEVRAAYAQAGLEAEIAPFFDDLHERMLRADLVVARAGASTVAELCAAGVASILVPYPHAADDHQMANARELERDGAAVVIPDAEVSTRLADEITRLAADAEMRGRMAEAMAARGRPDAAGRIWSSCKMLLQELSGRSRT